MIKKLPLFTVAALATAGMAAPASAQDNLRVQGTVAPFCNVNLATVSSGTATVAFLAEQKIANLRLACNSGGTTTLVVNPANGDLLSSANNRINYAFRLDSPDNAFDINQTDTAPGDTEGMGRFSRSRSGFSSALANGLALELFMNVNVQNESGQPDFAAPNQFPANAAPSGDYFETFAFTVSAV